ncbi:hypothetical protein AMECASPLE_037604 [Ameca splendens]|uniref:Uncharacterized protein n=1 Tax=Ameca splendens TaxID=208324 RepID=A0ABV1A3C5_9TELE
MHFSAPASLESFLEECGNPKSRRLRLMVPALFSNSKPSLSKNSPSLTPRSIHLPVHPPTSSSSHSGALLQKMENTNWKLLELIRSLPANHTHRGEGLIPPRLVQTTHPGSPPKYTCRAISNIQA